MVQVQAVLVLSLAEVAVMGKLNQRSVSRVQPEAACASPAQSPLGDVHCHAFIYRCCL